MIVLSKALKSKMQTVFVILRVEELYMTKIVCVIYHELINRLITRTHILAILQPYIDYRYVYTRLYAYVSYHQSDSMTYVTLLD